MADLKVSPSKGEDEGKKGTSLPLSRIRTIMKSSPDSEQLSEKAVLATTKACELFICQMARDAVKKSKNPKLLDYRDLAEVVDGNDKLEFLSSIIPKKITVREYKEIIENESDEEFDSMASSSEEGDTSSSEEPGTDNTSDVVEISSGDEKKD